MLSNKFCSLYSRIPNSCCTKRSRRLKQDAVRVRTASELTDAFRACGHPTSLTVGISHRKNNFVDGSAFRTRAVHLRRQHEHRDRHNGVVALGSTIFPVETIANVVHPSPRSTIELSSCATIGVHCLVFICGVHPYFYAKTSPQRLELI